MPEDTEAVEITICMGSSCFARGNSENLRILKDYLQRHGLQATVQLRGQLCHEQCKKGPNLMIQGRLLNGISSEQLVALLDAQFKTRPGQ